MTWVRWLVVLAGAAGPILGAESNKAPVNVGGGVSLPFAVRDEPAREIERHRVELRFVPQPAAEYYLERSGADLRSWIPLPGAPHHSGFYALESEAAAEFYRLRARPETASTVLRLGHVPIWRTNGLAQIVTFFPCAGWTHWVQTRAVEAGADAPWIDAPDGPHFTWVRLAPSAAPREIRVFATPPLDRAPRFAILIGGQSNAMLYDDPGHPSKHTNVVYLTEAHGFRSPARYNPLEKRVYTFSFATTGAAGLGDALGRPVTLIPAAVGATSIRQWLPSEDRWNPASLYGRLLFRAALATPGAIDCVWYFGHESSASPPDIESYARDWNRLLVEMRHDLGPVPMLYAQLGKSLAPEISADLHAAAEIQRQLENGQPGSPNRHHLVVAFDLPLADAIHLSPEAHHILGGRFELATRQHVLGESIEGTGPRLNRIEHPGGDRARIRVEFDRPINECVAAYEGQFRVFVDGVELAEFAVSRGVDGRSVAIQFAAALPGPVEISYGDRPAAGLNRFLRHVVRGANGLPAPQFARQSVQ